jgi:hypothetical protein
VQQGYGHSVLRVTANSEQARRLLTDLADNDELRDRLSRRESVADALREYGVEISDDLIPPEPTLPSSEEVREALKTIIGGGERPPPYVAFRPPWCVGVVAGPPPYGVIFSLIFNAIESRAAPSEAS